jgi:GTP-binding protein
MRVAELAQAGAFEVSGRGTLHLGILIENMRREGYEFQVGKPRPIFREEGGVRLEPLEVFICQTPGSSAGKVIEVLGARRGELVKYEPSGERVHLEIKVPARGLIGMGSKLMTLTAGEAVIYHSFEAYEPFKGAIPSRATGVMVSSKTGAAVPYALYALRDRGPMFVAPGEEVYAGMIVGEHCRDDDITVNVCREKKLTNIRAAGADENVILSPPRRMSIEEALEYIESDELLELTPRSVRLRKRVLDEKARRRDARA